MDVSTASRPLAPSPDRAGWDWRRELTSLDAMMSEVERQHGWDWRRDLAELEARLDQLAKKHNLPAEAH